MPVTTQHEQSAVLDGQEWLSSLPQETQLKTLSTQILKENLVTRNPTEISVAFTNCVEQEAWTKVAYMPSVKSKRRVLEYTSGIEWLRDHLGVELDQLMRSFAGHQPNAKDASEAVTKLLELIATEEPSTLAELSVDYVLGEAKMIGWKKLLEKLQEIDPVWTKPKNRLEQLIKDQKISLKDSNEISQEKNDLENKKEKKYLPKDPRSCLIRSLTKLKKSSLLCKSRNTTTKKVDKALNRLLRGLITVTEAKKEAGLNYVYKPYPVFSLRGEPKGVAKKILNTLGNESAALLALEILKEVE